MEGRTGTYHIQDIMRIINDGIMDRKQKIDNTWKVGQGPAISRISSGLSMMELWIENRR